MACQIQTAPIQRLEFRNESEEYEMPLVAIMNIMAFEQGQKGRKFDANFISVFNDKRGEFDYFIQRLAGREIENEADPNSGLHWVPYINGKREDWSYICENNRIVSKDDEIVFKFEMCDIGGLTEVKTKGKAALALKGLLQIPTNKSFLKKIPAKE